MKNQSKKSIQEIILDFLSGKKALKQKKLNKEIELFIKKSDINYCGNTKPKYIFNKTIKRMLNDNLIKEHETEFSSFLSLTKTGKNKLRKIKLTSQKHLVSTEWDGYWRIIIIDIPEDRKNERDALRYLLSKAQFVQIKNSMWISPFPMEHIMIAMKEDMNLNEELMIFVTDKLDIGTEQLLKDKFTEKCQTEKES